MVLTRSQQWFARAERVLAGGVNSPSRSYAAVGGGVPVFMQRGEGAYFYDVDGNRYIDYLAAFGALILGHGHPRVVEAVTRQIAQGAVYGTCQPLEVELAERIREAIPRMELLRFTASGTEAVMSAIRVARGFTGRSKILKFTGSYHGHSDLVLVAAGSGSSTFGLEDSAGLPPSVKQEVISIPYNDPQALAAAVDEHGQEIAAILFEPIVGNFGIVPPQPGFLKEVERAARKIGALLIDDEVITGFRFRYGAVYPLYDIEPDLVTIGKILGGGLAIGAYGGRREVMSEVTPLGPVYQNGTWAGNPLAMAAGLACLEVLRTPGLYDQLDRYGRQLEEGLLATARQHGVPVQINRVGGAFTLFFHDRPIRNFKDTEASSSKWYGSFFNELLQRGVLLPPSKFEAWFVSAAHTQTDIDQTLAAAGEALAVVAKAQSRD
ncbi:MAG: glutamate-1-semialdehyde 2,1-aminomutase [Limnochordaceae bacterium]|nr:glutamate-1-semialdehyde 2,1-aminomutase [Limnochordaceae bacterium]